MRIKRVTGAISILLLVTVTFAACNNNGNSQSPAAHVNDTIPRSTNKDQSIPGSFSNQTLLKFDSNQVKSFLNSFTSFKIFEKDVYTFYQSRKFAYAWFDENGLVETADNLYNRIKNISDEGLPDKIPYKEKFTEWIDELRENNRPSPSLELMLTCQYLLYAKNVWQGLPEKQSLAIAWLLPRKKISYSQLLDSLANSDILTNEPVFKQYHLLKEQLKKLKRIKEKSLLPAIKTDKKKLQQGDSTTVIVTIRNWLYVMGDIAIDNKSAVFDESLADAVKKFQRRLGLKDDAVIGLPVIAAMNYPVEKRIEAIMVNMERSRWVSAELQKNTC
ncbi:MAG: peptidoglycan-binding protein [Chitinophagaceae bacterium]|nr:peptidoglycan-binding protein [Chitinophagaceae bacterium]